MQTLPVVIGFFSLQLRREAHPFDRARHPMDGSPPPRQKLETVRLLQGRRRAIDGDGATDHLDSDRLATSACRSSGIMGVRPLALTDAFGAASC